jgi:hypothetical protein
LFLSVAGSAVCFSPALSADDLPVARLTVAADNPSAATSGSTLRWNLSESSQVPAKAPSLCREPSSNPTSASTSVTAEAAPKPLFSHTKWEGPGAVVPRQPVLQWKGDFQARRVAVTVDPGVIRTSGELPLETARPVALPTPARAGVRDALEPPPLPVQVAPGTDPSTAPMPTLEQQIARSPDLSEKCILPGSLKPIRNITADITIKPEDLVGGKPPECGLGDTPVQPRHWRPVTFAWTAAGTCHNPIYFEEEQLERYGHSWGPIKQTAVSAVQFFATAPLVPYFMGVYPPNECIYDLGQYRPGSCAPYYLDPLPLSVRGALYEGAFLGLLPAL